MRAFLEKDTLAKEAEKALEKKRKAAAGRQKQIDALETESKKQYKAMKTAQQAYEDTQKKIEQLRAGDGGLAEDEKKVKALKKAAKAAYEATK